MIFQGDPEASGWNGSLVCDTASVPSNGWNQKLQETILESTQKLEHTIKLDREICIRRKCKVWY